MLSAASYRLRRRQGDWAAGRMFTRSALFSLRDQVHWLASFSRQMDPIFHPDYRLLLAMNTGWGWDVTGNETAHVPMLQSALFALACGGIMFSGLASVQSPGQASLGLIVLWGTATLVNEGAREMADLPMTFFILATGILIYMYVLYQKPELISLAGLTPRLAAWTTNDGLLFSLVAVAALFISLLLHKPLRGHTAVL